MKTLYLIGGPMGVGKTATSKELKSMLPSSVMLDGDWCWDMHPFVVTDETKAMVMDNIAYLLGNFIRCSAFSHVIFCWVMHEQSIIDQLLSKIPVKGVRVVSLSLLCSPAELSRRLQSDIDVGLRTQDAIARSLERLPLYDALNTRKLYTDGMTAQEAARAILKL